MRYQLRRGAEYGFTVMGVSPAQLAEDADSQERLDDLVYCWAAALIKAEVEANAAQYESSADHIEIDRERLGSDEFHGWRMTCKHVSDGNFGLAFQHYYLAPANNDGSIARWAGKSTRVNVSLCLRDAVFLQDLSDAIPPSGLGFYGSDEAQLWMEIPPVEVGYYDDCPDFPDWQVWDAECGETVGRPNSYESVIRALEQDYNYSAAVLESACRWTDTVCRDVDRAESLVKVLNEIERGDDGNKSHKRFSVFHSKRLITPRPNSVSLFFKALRKTSRKQKRKNREFAWVVYSPDLGRLIRLVTNNTWRPAPEENQDGWSGKVPETIRQFAEEQGWTVKQKEAFCAKINHCYQEEDDGYDDEEDEDDGYDDEEEEDDDDC